MIKLERVINVLKTYDYDLFEMNKLNRTINETTVKNFMKDFEVDGYCTLSPIVVKEQDDKYLIIKGHHRFLACKRSNMPIYFTIDNTLTDEDIIRGEKTQNKYKSSDFIEGYAKQGKEHYIKFLQLEKMWKVPRLLMRVLLFEGIDGTRYNNKLKHGELIITEEMERKFKIRASNYDRLKDRKLLKFDNYQNWTRIMFILDDEELTSKFANYLKHNAYQITLSERKLVEFEGKTYKMDLIEKLSRY